jgi:hypothetical protein
MEEKKHLDAMLLKAAESGDEAAVSGAVLA